MIVFRDKPATNESLAEVVPNQQLCVLTEEIKKHGKYLQRNLTRVIS